MTGTASRRLLSHLAQFSSFSLQGELLCTRGLEYLLGHTAAKVRMVELLRSLGERHSHIDEGWVWRAEARQNEDGARPDLEALGTDGVVRIKIEAKLGAALLDEQLQSYAAHLQKQCTGGLLVILVPQKRVPEANAVALRAVPKTDARCDVVVLSWEQVLTALSTCREEPFAGDLAQFAAMYAALVDQLLAPVDASELHDGRKNPKFIRLVDLATREMSPPDRLLPFGVDDAGGRDEYRRRYICRALGAGEPCFSLGVRNSFDGHHSPVWMRFHRSTAMFPAIRDRLSQLSVANRVVVSGGHLWMAINILVDTPVEQVVKDIVTQVQQLVAIAYEQAPGVVADL